MWPRSTARSPRPVVEHLDVHRFVIPKSLLFAAGLASLLASAGCRPTVSIALPSGTAQPSPEATEWFATASAQCRKVTSWSAEIAASGALRGRTIRVRVLAGTTSAGQLRLEGVAPFGGPVFVLAASDRAATLWLPRESSAVREQPTADVMDALLGIGLSGPDVHALLTGCAMASGTPADGQVYGSGWASIDMGAERTVFLRQIAGAWRIAAASVRGIRIGYDGFAGGAPRLIRVTANEHASGRAVRLQLRLSQVEDNTPLSAETFTVDVPASAKALSLERLRERGLDSGSVSP